MDMRLIFKLVNLCHNAKDYIDTNVVIKYISSPLNPPDSIFKSHL